MLHNTSLVKWEMKSDSAHCAPYSHYLEANAWIASNPDDLPDEAEQLSAEVKAVISKKIALMKQFNAIGAAEKRTRAGGRMDVIKEATFEEDEESKSVSKVQYEEPHAESPADKAAKKKLWKQLQSNQPSPKEEIPIKLIVESIKSVEANFAQKHEEIVKRVESINEIVQVRVDKGMCIDESIG